MPNKIALITGVGPGTGSSLARCFHTEGYKVAMLARNNQRLKSLEKELPGSKGFICDVRNPESINKTVKNVIEELGQPDTCLLYTSPSPRDRQKSRMPSSA